MSGYGRLDAIEDRICAHAFNPLGATVREDATPRFRVLNTSVPFGAFQTLRECKVRKVHPTRLCTRRGIAAKPTSFGLADLLGGLQSGPVFRFLWGKNRVRLAIAVNLFHHRNHSQEHERNYNDGHNILLLQR